MVLIVYMDSVRSQEIVVGTQSVIGYLLVLRNCTNEHIIFSFVNTIV